MSYHAAVQKVVVGVKHKDHARSFIAEIPPFSSTLICVSLFSSARFLIRGAFFSLMQLAEAIALMKAHFFFLPPSSLGVLSVLSVLHTAALAIALGMRDSCLEALGNKRAPWLSESALISNVLVSVVVGSVVASFVMALCIVSFSGIHFTSPPIYRAMLMGWIVALPFEVAILLGLYSAKSRRLVIQGRRLLWCLIGEGVVGVLSIISNLPLLYLLSKFGLLAYALLLLFPKGSIEGVGGANAKVSRPLIRGVVWSLLVRGCGPAFIELAGKILYLPFALLDPSLAITLLVSHRLMHIASAFALRGARLISRVFQRVLVFGDLRQRFLVIRRAVVVVFISAASSTLLSPALVARYQLVSLSSPHNEYVDLSVWLFVVFGVVLLVRAAVSGIFSLMESHFVRAGIGIRPCFTLGVILLGAALFCSYGINYFRLGDGVTAWRPISVMFLELGILFCVAIVATVFCLYRCDFSWKRIGINGLFDAANQTVSVYKSRFDESVVIDQVARIIPASKPVRLNSGTLLAGRIKPGWIAPAHIFAYVETSIKPLDHLLLSMMQPSIQNLVGNARAKLLIEKVECLAFAGSLNEGVQLSGSDILIVPVVAALYDKHLPRYKEVVEYLDLLVSNGSISLNKAMPRRLRGLLHFNRGLAPHLIVIVGAAERVYLPEFAYATLQYNLFQAGISSQAVVSSKLLDRVPGNSCSSPTSF